jgi:hypothetical protein
MLGDYNATVRAGLEDDGFRASTPACGCRTWIATASPHR